MNLNAWYRVWWRRVDQWFRRQFFAFDTPIRRRLYDAKREIAINETLTDAQKHELARINRILGNGGVYRFTPEQRRRQAELAEQVMRDLRNKNQS